MVILLVAMAIFAATVWVAMRALGRQSGGGAPESDDDEGHSDLDQSGGDERDAAPGPD
jgi:hypothetical protein